MSGPRACRDPQSSVPSAKDRVKRGVDGKRLCSQPFSSSCLRRRLAVMMASSTAAFLLHERERHCLIRCRVEDTILIGLRIASAALRVCGPLSPTFWSRPMDGEHPLTAMAGGVTTIGGATNARAARMIGDMANARRGLVFGSCWKESFNHHADVL